MSILVQCLIILAISLMGEICHALIPLPIPAGIYGMLFLFIGLCTKLIPLRAVKTVGDFLIEIMPLTIVPSAVGLMNHFGMLQRLLIPLTVIAVLSTILVMGVSAGVTQTVIRHEKKKQHVEEESV